MRILRAARLGMCFGVRDAIALALEHADAGPLTVLGDLVHNPTVLGALESSRAAQGATAPRGVQFRWVLTLHAGKGGYVNQVWVLDSGEWGFGGETRGRSADLPALLGDLAGK